MIGAFGCSVLLSPKWKILNALRSKNVNLEPLVHSKEISLVHNDYDFAEARPLKCERIRVDQVGAGNFRLL